VSLNFGNAASCPPETGIAEIMELKSTTPILSQTRQQWALLLLTVCTFFILLGSRSLNEPDEGRYAEISREMIETGNWLVPQFWYMPHFDKPPMTYWLVAASMKLFGQNEWAVRLPLALAGLSGALAVWFLAKSIAGRRVAVWSVLILQSPLLYFSMSRMLTTDIFLTQFNAWAMYLLWRSWICLREPGTPAKYFWGWHLAGWLAIALGFMTKGPVALAIPLVSIVLLLIVRRKSFPEKRRLLGGIVVGMVLSLALAAPWYLAANARVPGTLNYMVFHQAAGHVLGTTIRTRQGFPGYFFVILPVGLLPWSWLLGWLWRREHWQRMPSPQQDGWLLLNFWSLFTFTLFNLTHSKLPAYILPIFPALAVLLALRFFRETEMKEPGLPPGWVWILCAVSPLFLSAGFPIVLPALLRAPIPMWAWCQAAILAVAILLIIAQSRTWIMSRRAATIVATAIASMLILAGEAPSFETDFRSNQTLKPLGALVQKNLHPGDALLLWKQLPEGLAFYSHGVISQTNRPYMGGMNLTRVPFEFTGNRERMRDLLLETDAQVLQLLSSDRRVVVIVEENTLKRFQNVTAGTQLQMLGKSGVWQLYANH
jgi:4-amino-4-deoxy-L-arabinose transferase-like glycosyltransferase